MLQANIEVALVTLTCPRCSCDVADTKTGSLLWIANELPAKMQCNGCAGMFSIPKLVRIRD